jgi:AcrR family transcriptional regulator
LTGRNTTVFSLRDEAGETRPPSSPGGDRPLAVVAKEGVEGASLSRVAAAAGTSVGLIQRYFQTRDQLLHFAFGHLWERTVERVRSVEPSDSVRTCLVRMLATFLPVDEERVFESRMWLAYIARAAVDPALARGHAEGMRESGSDAPTRSGSPVDRLFADAGAGAS